MGGNDMAPSDNDYHTGYNNPHGTYREGSPAHRGQLHAQNLRMIKEVYQPRPPVESSVIPPSLPAEGDFYYPREPTRLIEIPLYAILFGAPLAAGVVLNSWLWGLGALLAAALFYAWADDFLKSEAGHVIENVFNWCVGMSALSVGYVWVFYRQPSILTAVALCAGTSAVITSIQIIYRRRMTKAAETPPHLSGS
jgi:hypothetical protein